jgi:TatA/E family protein of Tat protein translocase
MPEMIFIFLLALLIFGPRKLPEVGRQIGKALAEFKRASNTFKSQLDMEMRNLELQEDAKKPATPSIQPPEHTIGTGSAIPPRVDPESYASESGTPAPADETTSAKAADA